MKGKLIFVAFLLVIAFVVSWAIYSFQQTKHQVAGDDCLLVRLKEDETATGLSLENVSKERCDAILDSLKKHDGKYLFQEKLNRLIYCEHVDTLDYQGIIHIVDITKLKDSHFVADVNDVIDCILPLDCDSIVYVFSWCGTAHVTQMTRINVKLLRQVSCMDACNGFEVQKIVHDGFEGTCFHRAQDCGMDYAGFYKTKIDIDGNILYHEKIPE